MGKSNIQNWKKTEFGSCSGFSRCLVDIEPEWCVYAWWISNLNCVCLRLVDIEPELYVYVWWISNLTCVSMFGGYRSNLNCVSMFGGYRTWTVCLCHAGSPECRAPRSTGWTSGGGSHAPATTTTTIIVAGSSPSVAQLNYSIPVLYC